LRITDLAELQGLINSYKTESDDLIDQIHSIMWHMRGGLTREEAWTLSHNERRRLLKQIEERVKMVEKTGLPII